MDNIGDMFTVKSKCTKILTKKTADISLCSPNSKVYRSMRGDKINEAVQAIANKCNVNGYLVV